LGGLVTSLSDASSTIDASEDSVDLLMGSVGAVASTDATRMTSDAQSSLLTLSLSVLDTANGDDRIAISEAASASACSALAALIASDDLFGPGANLTNNSATSSSNISVALSAGLNNLASGTLVNMYAGMGATVTSCKGLLISAEKIEASDTDGSLITAGNSSFTFPANFSKMTNMSAGDTIETSSQVFSVNPHRGASNASINTDTTSLSLLLSSTSGASRKFPVANLTAPISIRIPLKSLGSVKLSCHLPVYIYKRNVFFKNIFCFFSIINIHLVFVCFFLIGFYRQ
jgi:hypothetical protein